MVDFRKLKLGIVTINPGIIDPSIGFVVDAQRGIVLANRDVVLDPVTSCCTEDPVGSEAIFANKEEVSVTPIYLDPVHDFGFYGYDPVNVYRMAEEIPLSPEFAYVGLEIYVVGKDSIEAEALESGRLARDRDDRNGYYEFDNVDMTATGESDVSGSLLVDEHGRAVAMTGTKTNEHDSVYFVPLERVVRALQYIKNSKDSSECEWKAVTIPRGTLQTTFIHKNFNKALKLGLKWETQQMVKDASPAGETGVLVVDSVSEDAPANEQLKQGDFLITMNEQIITTSLMLEEVVDESVDKNINLLMERTGTFLNVTLPVDQCLPVPPPENKPSSSSIKAASAKGIWKLGGGGSKCHKCGEKSNTFTSFFEYNNHLNGKEHKGGKQQKNKKKKM